MTESRSNDAEGFFKSHVESYRNEHYGRHRSFMSVRQEAYLRALDRLPLGGEGVRALEAGCGPGLMSHELRGRGFEVTAFDTSPAMLGLTRDLLDDGGPPPRLAVADIEHLPYADETFDLYVSAGVIEYLSGDEQFLRETHRVLRPGGHAVLSITNVSSPAGYLDSFVEAGKRNPAVLGVVNRGLRAMGKTEARSRHFKVRRHRPGNFRDSVTGAGFEVAAEGFFHFMPWPHPFDRLFPSLNHQLGKRMEGLSKSALRGLGEGYFIVGRK